MQRIKGPAVFLAQFLRDEEPFCSVASLGKWFAGMGYRGVQVPAYVSDELAAFAAEVDPFRLEPALATR